MDRIKEEDYKSQNKFRIEWNKDFKGRIIFIPGSSLKSEKADKESLAKNER